MLSEYYGLPVNCENPVIFDISPGLPAEYDKTGDESDDIPYYRMQNP